MCGCVFFERCEFFLFSSCCSLLDWYEVFRQDGSGTSLWLHVMVVAISLTKGLVTSCSALWELSADLICISPTCDMLV